MVGATESVRPARRFRNLLLEPSHCSEHISVLTVEFEAILYASMRKRKPLLFQTLKRGGSLPLPNHRDSED